ncbi:hypothetical protein HZH68_012586 [Vespula germanica]|uniref:Odorant receptor n=1 Tax=Vespula germanica TaxID=30212 RepID=A0A834JHY6_VESGE|nr:hypothetical protein HZH68_012586 [Vespula germanica]
MSLECQFYCEQPLLLSNRIVQSVLGLHPSQCSSDQLFQCCTLAVYVFPMILHQFYQLVVSDIKLQSTCKLLQKLLGIFCITCTYSVVYFRSSTLQKLCIYLKRDYEQFVDKEEVNIYNKCTKRNKLYVIILCNSCILYGMSLTIPSIVNLFLHTFGLIDNVQLTLPFPVNNVLKAGLLYYFLLIYEIIGIFVVLLIAYENFHLQILELSTILQSLSETMECGFIICASLLIIYINFYVGQMLINHNKAAFQEFSPFEAPVPRCGRTATDKSHDQQTLLRMFLKNLILGLHPSQSSTNQLLQWSVIAVFLIPMIAHQIKQLFAYHKRDYEQFSDEKEICIYEKYTKKNKLFTIIFIGFCYLYAFSLTIPSVFNVFRYIIGSNEDIQLTLPLPVNNVHNAGILFKIRQPFNEQKSKEKDSYNITYEEEWEWIVDIIKRYTTITELMLQLSTILQNTNGIFECFVITIGSVLTIYINFYIGQMLINQSTEAFEELYQVPFYMLSINTQKLLLFTISRSMKPCEISIGGVFVASNEIFSGFYQLAMSDVTLESTVKVLQKMLAALSILWIYTTAYFSFVNVRVIFVVLASLFLIKETFKNVESVSNFQMKQIFSQLKLDYALMSGKDELEIMLKYNKGSKMYAYMVTGFFNIYFIATVTPCVLNVFLYHIGTSENVNLTLPIPINNISNPGIIYYALLIYQIVAMYISVILGSACFSLYLVLVHHACCQLSIIRLKIGQPFRDYQKSNQKFKCDKTVWDEFGWIVDIIEHYKKVTMCQIPFYMISIRTQKLLVLMILRSSKPCVLSFGSMFVSSHELFVGIMHKAFSFAMAYYSIH